MFSFSKLERTTDGKNGKDEDPLVKESQNNEDRSGIEFDDCVKDSFEDVAEQMEESNGYSVQEVDHSLEEVAKSQEELNCNTIHHNSNSLEGGAESKKK